MYFRKILILLVTILTVLVLTSCSGGGDGGRGEAVVNKPATAETPLEDIEDLDEFKTLVGVLKSESINNTQELEEKVNSEDPLEFFLRLKAIDASLHAEDMMRLMKSLEYEVALKPLKTSGKISEAALKSLKIRDLSIMRLKSGPLRQFSGVSTPLTSTAQDEYNKEQWIAYNNELAAFGIPQLGFEEFKALKSAIKSIPALFINFGTAMQNVDINSSSKAPRYFSSGFKASAVGVLGELNPVDETTGAQHTTPTAYLEFLPNKYKACRGIARTYPFHVMGTEDFSNINGNPIIQLLDTSGPLLGDEDSKRYFQINETGLASLLISNKSFSSVNLVLEHAGQSVFNITLAGREKRKVFIPVSDADVCVPYYITKDDINIEATVLALTQPVEMQPVLDTSRGAYDLIGHLNISQVGDTFLSAGATTFNLIDVVDGSERVIDFYSSNDEWHHVTQFIAQAPSGKLYSEVSAGSGEMDIVAENGEWLVYAFPIVLVGGSYDPYEFDPTTNIYSQFEVMHENSNGYDDLEYTISVATSKVAKLKKFIISEMKNAEFSHDGEDDGRTAEVTVSLHSNVAPKLELGADLGDAFVNDEAYGAHQCWLTHGRDIDQFRENQACYAMRDGIDKIYREFLYVEFGLPKNTPDYLVPPLSLKGKTFKQSLFVWYGKDVNNRLNDERYARMSGTYASAHEEWENSVVQINDMDYPSAYYYGIIDSRPKGILGTEYIYHPNIPIHIPILAVPKERMATTSVPFAFEYSAHDSDEVDSSAQIFAVVKLVVNQALAVATGNYAALICNTVDTMQEMRQNEIDGEDDPIGEADFFLNRFSSEDSFYGISGDKDLEFAISGLATIPNHYTSFDEDLEYAALACDIGGSVVAGYNLYNSLGGLISGDFYNGLGLADLRSDALEGLDENSALYGTINDAFDAIEAGNVSGDVFETLKASNQLGAFADGIDIFQSLADVNSDLGGLGGAGHNVMRSEASYFFSSFDDRKTRSNIVVKEVGAQPVEKIKVTLNRVHILSNYENGDAEVKLRSRVGVVSDETPTYQGAFATNAPFMSEGALAYDNGSHGYQTLPNLPFKGYLVKNRNFNGVADGDDLDFDTLSLYDATYPSSNNAAAIYVEVGLFEGDGGGVDDDMIGVYSKTFYLEDIYNIVDGMQWSGIGGRVQKLEVLVPVYDAFGLATSVELLNTENRDKQLAHNKARLNDASAYISFTIEVTLGQYVDYDEVDVGATSVDGDPNHGKDPMDMSLINLKAVSSLRSTDLQLHDVYHSQAVVMDKEHGIRVAQFDAGHQLSWRTAINGNNLSGDAVIFNDVNSSRFRYEPLHRTRFIDDDNLLVFQRNIPRRDLPSQLMVIGIPENNASTSVIKRKLLPDKAANLATTRVNANHLKAFVTIPDLENNSGEIKIYNIGTDGITEVGSYPMIYTPTDILAIDDKTILVKSEKFKHHYFDTTPGLEHDEYWTTQLYLELLELDENNNLIAKDVRQYTYGHYSDAEWSGALFPDMALDTDFAHMRNVNNGLLNHIVYTGVMNATNGIHKPYLNLIYNNDTGSYRFGSKRKTLIFESIENPDYAYYLDKYLNAYPSDLSLDNRVYTGSKSLFSSGEQFFSGSHKTYFLDSRYVLSYMHVTSMQESLRGDALVLIDTLHVDNTSPTITSDDFDQEHILDRTNSYHDVINFHVDDNESSVSDMNISFKILDPDTNATIYEGKNAETNALLDPENFWFASRLDCESNGDCSMNIAYLYDVSYLHRDKICAGLKHNYELNVRDGDITVTKRFSVWETPTLPNIEGAATTAYRYDDRFSDINGAFASSTAGDGGSDGCVERFEFDNKPAWITAAVDYDLVGDRKILRLEGTPPLGTTPGIYDIGIHAINPRGEDVEHFVITVNAPDIIPDAFVLNHFADVNRSEIVSDSFVVTGIQADVNMTISGGEYSFDEVTWSSSEVTVSNNDKVYVRHTSASDYASDVSTTVNVGGVEATMSSRTIPDPSIEDTTPDIFSFVDVTGAALNSNVESEMTVSGINHPTPLSIIGGEYSLDDAQTWSSATVNIENGQRVIVRQTSASSYQTTTDTMVSIGGISDTFSSTTKVDNDPDAFSFTPQTNVAPNTTYASSVVISGLGDGVNAEVLLTGFARNQSFRVNGLEQTTISNGDTLTLSHVSSADWDTDMVQTVQIGSFSTSFVTHTRSEFAAVPNIVGAPNSTANINEFYSYTPQLASDSPSVDSWSIVNKPDWASFNTATGELSGTPTVVAEHTGVTITATNSDGSDSISFTLRVVNYPPYIDGGMHTLDEDEMLFNFTDNSAWRSAVTGVVLNGVNLSSGTDYLLEAGTLRLYVNGTNNVPTTADEMWTLVISATGFDDVYVSPYVEHGAIDLDTARSTLVLENAPFRPGERSKVKLQTVDRFGNNLSYAGVRFTATVTQNDSTYIEPYKIKSVDDDYYKLLENNETIDSNETGWVEAYVQVPACVDVNDGFELVLKRSSDDAVIDDSYSYVNGVSMCNDNDWKVRFANYGLTNLQLLSDTDGNLYVVGSTNSGLEGQSNHGSYDIYLAKLDRNGVIRWEQLIGGSGEDRASQIIMGSDGYLYLSAITSGDIDEGSGLHAGSYDWVLIKVNADSGIIVYKKQQGTALKDTTCGLTQNALYTNVIVDSVNGAGDTETFMHRFTNDGVFVDTIGLYDMAGCTGVKMDSAHNNIIENFERLDVFDENGTYIKRIHNSSRNLEVDANDSLFISDVKRYYASYADNFYGDPIPSDKAVAVIEKRSANGYYIWSHVLSPGDTQSSGMSARMNDAVYVPHSDSHSVIQGSGTITITSLYLDVLNQYDGTLMHTKTWESDVANDEIRVKAITANEATHSIYMVSEVNNNGKYPGTNQYDGNIVIMKSIEYDTATDSRSGIERNDALKIVNDYDNNLQWVDDSFNIESQRWIYSTDACSYIYMDNGETWRFPTLAELVTTIDSSNDPAFKSVFTFQNDDHAYFTSEEVDAGIIKGVFYSSGGGSANYSKENDYLYIRCVRDMER